MELLDVAAERVQEYLDGNTLVHLEGLTNFARWCISQTLSWSTLPYREGVPAVKGVWEYVLDLLQALKDDEIDIDDIQTVLQNEEAVVFPLAQWHQPGLCFWCNLDLEQSSSRLPSQLQTVPVCSHGHRVHTGCLGDMLMQRMPGHAKVTRGPICVLCLEELEVSEDSLETLLTNRDNGLQTVQAELKALASAADGRADLDPVVRVHGTSNGPLCLLILLLASGKAPFQKFGSTQAEFEQFYAARVKDSSE